MLIFIYFDHSRPEIQVAGCRMSSAGTYSEQALRMKRFFCRPVWPSAEMVRRPEAVVESSVRFVDGSG